MRVLFASHTSRISGAERSFLDLLGLLPQSVEATLACPPGPLADRVRALDIPVVGLPEIGGLGGGRLVGAARIAYAALVLRGRAAATRADLVHATSVRAGLAAVLSSRLGGPRVVVDVRDCLSAIGAPGKAQRFLARAGCTVIANSDHTAASFRAATGTSPRVVRPLVDLEPFLKPALSRTQARRRLGLPEGAPVLAVVGQISPWKGQRDAIQAMSRLRRTFPDAVLLLAGDVKFDVATHHDNRAYEASLRAQADALGEAVHFAGEREDIAALLPGVDILLVPSWEEPFGRVVLEGMASGVTVIATAIGGPSEVIRDGVDGVLLPPRTPDRWAAAASALLLDPARRSRIGAAARARAQDFQDERDDRLAAVIDTYLRPRGCAEPLGATSLV
jgi:glycosyltransferase involved in cell wall biosynthesis